MAKAIREIVNTGAIILGIIVLTLGTSCAKTCNHDIDHVLIETQHQLGECEAQLTEEQMKVGMCVSIANLFKGQWQRCENKFKDI